MQILRVWSTKYRVWTSRETAVSSSKYAVSSITRGKSGFAYSDVGLRKSCVFRRRFRGFGVFWNIGNRVIQAWNPGIRDRNTQNQLWNTWKLRISSSVYALIAYNKRAHSNRETCTIRVRNMQILRILSSKYAKLISWNMLTTRIPTSKPATCAYFNIESGNSSVFRCI